MNDHQLNLKQKPSLWLSKKLQCRAMVRSFKKLPSSQGRERPCCKAESSGTQLILTGKVGQVRILAARFLPNLYHSSESSKVFQVAYFCSQIIMFLCEACCNIKQFSLIETESKINSFQEYFFHCVVNTFHQKAECNRKIIKELRFKCAQLDHRSVFIGGYCVQIKR